jgi:hypothetical protein
MKRPLPLLINSEMEADFVERRRLFDEAEYALANGLMSLTGSDLEAVLAGFRRLKDDFQRWVRNASWDEQADFAESLRLIDEAEGTLATGLMSLADNDLAALAGRRPLDDDFQRRLRNAFWDELEKAGERPLCEKARAFIQGVIVRYDLWDRPPERKKVAKVRESRAKKLEALAAEIEADPLAIYFLNDVGGDARPPERAAVDLPIRLRAYAEWMLCHPSGQVGRRYRDEDDMLITMAADIYHRIGGRVVRPG